MPDQVGVHLLDHPITESYVGGGHAKLVPQNEAKFSTPIFAVSYIVSRP